MGMYHTIQAFRFTDMGAFEEALNLVAQKHGGEFRTTPKSKDPEVMLRVCATASTITIDYPQAINPFIVDLGLALGAVPEIEVRIQDSSHWDYSLVCGHESLDNFSTFPQYWEGDDCPDLIREWRGDAGKLSATFGVPVENFERYLRHWYSDWDSETEEYRNRLRGKAYPDDRYEYGDYDQFWDFLPRIGIQDPCAEDAEASEWELILPNRSRFKKNDQKRSWWRRLFG